MLSRRRSGTYLLPAVPRIVHSPGVCGGAARIDGTRIPVWTLEGFWRQGVDDEWLLEQYPSLYQTDLDAARAYIAGHQEEIEADLRAQDEEPESP